METTVKAEIQRRIEAVRALDAAIEELYRERAVHQEALYTAIQQFTALVSR